MILKMLRAYLQCPLNLAAANCKYRGRAYDLSSESSESVTISGLLF